MRQARTEAGFTVVEMLVALALLTIVVTAFSMTMMANLKANSSSGQRTAGARVLPAVSGQLEQQLASIPQGETWPFVYQVGDSLQRMSPPADLTNCQTYLASITETNIVCSLVRNSSNFNPSTPDGPLLGLTPARIYDITICWKDRGEVKCSAAKTIGN